MKIWYGFGSEHSMNLVMIGRFRTVEEAKNAEDIFEKLKEQLARDQDLSLDNSKSRYSEGMLDLLGKSKLYSLDPGELEQLWQDVSIKRKDEKLHLWTDELEVLVFVKALLELGAHVEVFSAHTHSQSGDDVPH
jgi:hypothetical protein